MVSSKVIKSDAPDITFPKLMVSDGGRVVLFERHGVGTIVGSIVSQEFEVGSYSSSWAMDCFRDFHGEVTISSCKECSS